MRVSAKDELKGKAHEVKGAAKQKMGQLTNDPKLEAAGRGEKTLGRIQKKIGHIEKAPER